VGRIFSSFYDCCWSFSRSKINKKIFYVLNVRRGNDKNPLRVLDCKKDSCRRTIEEAPLITENLCQECKSHFAQVKTYLDDQKIIISWKPWLVRGLDYYNRTVFEFWPLDKDGTVQGSLALGGGGRYDGLIEYMGVGKLQLVVLA